MSDFSDTPIQEEASRLRVEGESLVISGAAAKWIQRALSEAWAEGYDAGHWDGQNCEETPNPYKGLV